MPLACLVLALPAILAAPGMPLPPGLEKDAVVVKAGSSRTIVLGKPRPIRLEPYAIRDLETGTFGAQAGSAGVARPPLAVEFRWNRLEAGFSFRLEDERATPVEVGRVLCDWGTGAMSGEASRGRAGVELRIPDATALACEIVLDLSEESWRLFLWTDRPTNVLVPEFPSGGTLVRGAVRYDTSSTNVVEPLGLKATRMTGTLFLRDGRPVAAVERMLPGRILLSPSLEPAERSLFLVAGAAIFTYDHLASSGSR